MNFDDFSISEEDFEFFCTMDSKEKILFLHDLICSNYYGNGSTEIDFDTILDNRNFEENISRLIEISIEHNSTACLVVVNDLAIINSSKKNWPKKIATDLMTSGTIIRKISPSKRERTFYKKQRYFSCYKIIGLTQQISLN